MKKHLKQFLAVVTVLIMVLAAVPTFAEEGVNSSRNVYAQIHAQKGYILGSYHPTKTTVKCTMSKNLGKVKKTRRSDGYDWYYFYPSKPGKTIVTIKSKDKTSNSRTETAKHAFTILKYQNPVSSIKIGSTKISGSKFNKMDRISLSYNKYSQKSNAIKVVAKKGWTYDGIMAYDKAGNQIGYDVLKSFQAAGGKGNYILKAVFTNKKTKAAEAVEIVFK